MSLSNWFRPALRARIFCAALLLLEACSPAQAPPAIAAGERPVTGDARYDRFFAELAELVREVAESEREEREVRAALARRVGLPGDVAIEMLGARLRERTEKLALDGLSLELEFTGIEDAAAQSQPSALLETPGRQPAPMELRLLEVVSQAALSGATIYVEMGRIQGRTSPLLEEAGKLQGKVNETFASAGTRDDVRAKLAEAVGLLPQLNERARAAGNSADTLISLLHEAANTRQLALRRRTPRDGAGREAPAGERPARRIWPKEPGKPEAASPEAPARGSDLEP